VALETEPTPPDAFARGTALYTAQLNFALFTALKRNATLPECLMDSFCLARLAFTRLAPFIVFICESVGCGATAIRSLVHVRAASGER